MEKVLFHYTNSDHIRQIIEDGFIKLATANVPDREKPAVFFSYDQHWERTCTKDLVTDSGLKSLNFEEMAERGIYRIAIKKEATPYNIHQYRKMSGMASKDWKYFKEYAEEVRSNLNDYRISFTPVFKKDWIRIEKYNTSTNLWELFDNTYNDGNEVSTL